MKIRIGVRFAGWPFERTRDFWDFVDLVEDSGLDSIWLNDRIRTSTPALEPITGLAMIAGRTERIKFGMSVAVLPVRDPLVLAKEIATIDFLSNGRMLPAFGLGVDNDAEWLAVGRTPRHRGAMTDEAVGLMRRLWSEDAVTHAGQFYHTHELTLYPKPKQQPIPIWFGGRSPAAYKRIGRLGDGFLGSFRPPRRLCPLAAGQPPPRARAPRQAAAGRAACRGHGQDDSLGTGRRRCLRGGVYNMMMSFFFDAIGSHGLGREVSLSTHTLWSAYSANTPRYASASRGWYGRAWRHALHSKTLRQYFYR